MGTFETVFAICWAAVVIAAIYTAGRFQNRKVYASIQDVKQTKTRYQVMQARMAVGSEVVKGERK